MNNPQQPQPNSFQQYQPQYSNPGQPQYTQFGTQPNPGATFQQQQPNQYQSFQQPNPQQPQYQPQYTSSPNQQYPNQTYQQPLAANQQPLPNQGFPQQHQTPQPQPNLPNYQPTFSVLWSKLYEKAFKNKKLTYPESISSSNEEKALFTRYNKAIPDKVDSSGRLQPLWQTPSFLKYIPVSVYASESAPTGRAPIYPVFGKDLGFDPKTSYFQRFSQNVYVKKDDRRLEERDITVVNAEPVTPKQMGLESYEAIETFKLFKKQMEAEAFTK